MELSPRQKIILEMAIEDYIKTAEPISSFGFLDKHDLGLCSATIRNDMLYLTRHRYFSQPYSSSGRVPTDKGYKFLVDTLINSRRRNYVSLLNRLESVGNDSDDLFLYSQRLLKELSYFSPGLFLSYSFDKDLFWRGGWEELILQPEFEEDKKDFRKNFLKFLDQTEKDFRRVSFDNNFNEVKVFIGKENPHSSKNDFSLIVTKTHFPKTKKGFGFALLGPKRMPYRRNLDIFHTLSDFFTNI